MNTALALPLVKLGKRRITLTLESSGSDMDFRLQMALKTLWRQFGLKCVRIYEEPKNQNV